MFDEQASCFNKSSPPWADWTSWKLADSWNLYRAMAFLGDAVEQLQKPTGAVRWNKDLIEEALFERRRELLYPSYQLHG